MQRAPGPCGVRAQSETAAQFAAPAFGSILRQRPCANRVVTTRHEPVVTTRLKPAPMLVPGAVFPVPLFSRAPAVWGARRFIASRKETWREPDIGADRFINVSTRPVRKD